MKWTKPTHFGIDWEHRGKDSETGRELHPGNSMPAPYQELSMEEYLRLAFCQPWGPTGEGNYRQVLDLPGPSRWALHIQHYTDYSLAVAEKFQYKTHVEEGLNPTIKVEAVGGRAFYALRFFKLGCAHEYKEVSHDFAHKELGINTWGMFCHVYHCPKCGHHYSVDSSG